MNRECAGTITSTGIRAVVASSSIGRREPHVALRGVTRIPYQPFSRVRTAMLGPQQGHVLPEPRRDSAHPTRSASTLAGIPGCSKGNARTRP